MGERLRKIARDVESREGRRVEQIKRKILAPQYGHRGRVGTGMCWCSVGMLVHTKLIDSLPL